MQAIINGIQAIYQFFCNLYDIVERTFQSIYYAMVYVKRTVEMEWGIILTLPNWIAGFVIISMTMSIALIIAGRYRGK